MAVIFITGATGFIGRSLTRELCAAGHTVRVLARRPEKAFQLFGDQVEIFTGDLSDAALLARACTGASLVYHIAGAYRFGLRHRKEVWRVNVDGTENLLQATFRAGVEKVVYIGSGGILRRSDRRKPLMDETDFPATPPPFSSYKLSKWEAERRVLEWARRGLHVTIASPTCPIGAEDEMPTPTGRIIRDFLDGNFPFSCRAGLNFVSVDDLSAGLQLAARHGRSGERYLFGHENMWLRDFLHILQEETGLKAPRFTLPGGVIWAAGAGGEAVDFLQGFLPGGDRRDIRICLETAYHSRRVQFFSCEKAARELGWEPVRPLRETVREAIAWFQDGVRPVREASAEAPVPVAL
ncbi:MAG: NAD-dependent epimerase/dehydratase family protein [Verrucomicrobium sp.]|nr:NAD-dependent epimerase/dehydratase family protein [Verrucomicrobium sp.]